MSDYTYPDSPPKGSSTYSPYFSMEPRYSTKDDSPGREMRHQHYGGDDDHEHHRGQHHRDQNRQGGKTCQGCGIPTERYRFCPPCFRKLPRCPSCHRRRQPEYEMCSICWGNYKDEQRSNRSEGRHYEHSYERRYEGKYDGAGENAGRGSAADMHSYGGRDDTNQQYGQYDQYGQYGQHYGDYDPGSGQYKQGPSSYAHSAEYEQRGFNRNNFVHPSRHTQIMDSRHSGDTEHYDFRTPSFNDGSGTDRTAGSRIGAESVYASTVGMHAGTEVYDPENPMLSDSRTGTSGTSGGHDLPVATPPDPTEMGWARDELIEEACLPLPPAPTCPPPERHEQRPPPDGWEPTYPLPEDPTIPLDL